VTDYGLENVSVAFGAQSVLSDVSLALPQGITCLMGPSGGGKTTVLRLLAGLITPDAGTVSRPEKVAVQFQEDRLLPWYTALQNVTLVMEGEDAATRAGAQLRALGLDEEQWGKKPAELSGGMCRRVALARALCYPAPLILLDEPTRGLDPETREQVADRLAAQVRKAGQVCLWITHDPKEAERVADVTVNL